MSASDDALPAGWTLTTLADVGSIRLGRQRSPDKHTGRFPTKYLRAANIKPNGLDLSDVLEMDFTPAERAVYGLQSGDLVLAEASGSAAHVGRANIWRDEIAGCCYQNTVIRFRPHAVTPEFALILFENYTTSGVFGRLARGVGILHLGASRLATLQVRLPPYAEQNRISEEVDRRRAEVREAEISLRSALDRIQEQKREVLAAAVAGELVPSEGTLQFEEQAKHEPRPSPDGWRWVRVDDAGEVALGKKREPSSHQGPDMRPYLRVANVFEDRIDTTDVKAMNFSTQEFEKYELSYGDILLNEGQSPELVGRPAMYRGDPPNACYQMTLLRFRAGAEVDAEFALIVFRHYLHSGEFQRVAQGSTNIAHLSRKRLAALPFPLPPLAEQARIVAEVKRRLDAAAAQEQAVRASIDRLPSLMAELLSAAVAGELVPQREEDESATELLERLGPPLPDDRAAEGRAARALNEEETVSKPSSDENSVENINSLSERLAQTLRDAGKPLALPDLFSAAGYSRDSITDVETFYLALRAAYGVTIRALGDLEENPILEAVRDAPQ